LQTAASSNLSITVEPGAMHSHAFHQSQEDLTTRYVEAWLAAATALHQPWPTVDRKQKLCHETQIEECIARFKKMAQRYPRMPARRELWHQQLLDELRQLATGCFGLPETGVNRLFTRAALEASRQFIHDARTFDPRLSDENLFQAMRNLWIIHMVQLLFESEIALSPPAFAYSMLYPLTDNYLDELKVLGRSKARFGVWLDHRLSGACREALDARGEQIGRMVALIESSYARNEYEEVYLSLRAIHRAQMESLEQQRPDPITDEQRVLQITFRKGGTSVLADAYLVKGRLSEEEAAFMFGYGVVLQLMDDLQDFQPDLANGHMTIFTRRAAMGALDEDTSRLWSFLRTVLWHSRGFAAPRFEPLKSLIQESCKLMILQAVAQNHKFYTSRFVEEMEACSPVCFSFLRTRGKTLAAEYAKTAGSLRKHENPNGIASPLAAI
jgi:hypothetical protein